MRFFPLSVLGVLLLFILRIHTTPSKLGRDAFVSRRDTTPLSSLMIFVMCRHVENSCRKHCGYSKEEVNEARPLVEITCSCDMMCQAYGDCCWDYFLHCSHIAKKYQGVIFDKDNKGSCWSGSQVLTECNDIQSFDQKYFPTPGEGFLAQRAFTPIITDRSTNTNYANISTFACLNTNVVFFVPPTESFLVWDLYFQAESEPEIQDIKDMMTQFQNRNGEWERHLKSEPSSDFIKPRNCAKPVLVQIYCQGNQYQSDPKFEEVINSVSQMCRDLFAKPTTQPLSSPAPTTLNFTGSTDIYTTKSQPVSGAETNSFGQFCVLRQKRTGEAPVGFRAKVNVTSDMLQLRVIRSDRSTFSKVTCALLDLDSSTNEMCAFSVDCVPGRIYHGRHCMGVFMVFFIFEHSGKQADTNRAHTIIENSPYLDLRLLTWRSKRVEADDATGRGRWQSWATYSVNNFNFTHMDTPLNVGGYVWEQIRGMAISNVALCLGSYNDTDSLPPNWISIDELEEDRILCLNPESGGKQVAVSAVVVPAIFAVWACMISGLA